MVKTDRIKRSELLKRVSKGSRGGSYPKRGVSSGSLYDLNDNVGQLFQAEKVALGLIPYLVRDRRSLVELGRDSVPIDSN